MQPIHPHSYSYCVSSADAPHPSTLLYTFTPNFALPAGLLPAPSGGSDLPDLPSEVQKPFHTLFPLNRILTNYIMIELYPAE